MRLWSQQIISKLPQQQLSGQWREVIALLGNGWGRKHSTVNYVFLHSEDKLVAYSNLIADESERRGGKPNRNLIRLALLKRHSNEIVNLIFMGANWWYKQDIIYLEHSEDYKIDCINNLYNKGIIIK